jgi:hypothetical protein
MLLLLEYFECTYVEQIEYRFQNKNYNLNDIGA